MGTDPLRPRRLFDRDVPAIAVGCAPLADMPEAFAYRVPEDRALATVRAALDSDFPWLDTAAKYGDGESERRIGIVLRERGGLPDGAFLDTKVGRDPVSGEYSGRRILERFDRSRTLLGLETIDLVFLHDPEEAGWDVLTTSGGLFDVVRELKSTGAAAHIGVAGGDVELMRKCADTGIFEAVITHNRYTLLNRSAGPLIDDCAAANIPILNAAPYGGGLLAKGPSAYPRYAYGDAPDWLLDRSRRIEEICRSFDVPIAAAALQFSLRDPRITATIVGMTKPERLHQTSELARIDIPDACWQRLRDVPFDTSDITGGGEPGDTNQG